MSRCLRGYRSSVAPKKNSKGFFYSYSDEKLIAYVEPLPKPVTLDAIKTEPKLKAMVLANNTRLSVQPVTDAEWKIVCKMGGL